MYEEATLSWHTALDLGRGGIIFVDGLQVTDYPEDIWDGGYSSKLDFE